MKNKRAFLNNLKRELEVLQEKITNSEKYNKKARYYRLFFKSCIYLDKVLPFLLSIIICSNLNEFQKNSPFRIDEKTEFASMEEIHTSLGIIKTKESFDKSYDNKVFEYSTGWYLNASNLYEKDTTYYRYSDIKNHDIDEILNMTPEELAQLFTIINIERIVKDNISTEELMEEPVISISTISKEPKSVIRDETFLENALVFFIFLCYSCPLGVSLFNLKKLILKNRIKEFLTYEIDEYQELDPATIANLKEIFEIKLDNYKLLTSNEERDQILERGQR